jgi:inner membrane transporter RhtA
LTFIHVADQAGRMYVTGRRARPGPAVGGPGRRSKARVPAAALVLLSVVSVQVGHAYGKHLFGQAGPLGVATLRLTLAAAILLALWRPRVPRDASSAVLVAGFGCAIAGMNLIYPALQHLPLGVATGLQLTGPLALALVVTRRKADLAWTVLAVAGVALFYAPGASPPSLPGVLLSLASGAAMAAYLLMSRRAGARATDGSLLAWAVGFAAVLLLPFGAVESGAALLDPGLVCLATGVAVVSAVLPYSLDLSALRRLPPRVVGVLESLEPAVAGLAGLLVLREHLAVPQWAALACVSLACIGVVLTRGGRRSPDGEQHDRHQGTQKSQHPLRAQSFPQHDDPQQHRDRRIER